MVTAKDGSLQVTATHDAGCPIREGQTPTITCDVWEPTDIRALGRPQFLAQYRKLLVYLRDSVGGHI